LHTSAEHVLTCGVEMSKAERTLSNSLLSLITSRPSVSSPHLDADPDEDHPYRSQRESGLMNEDGAWCWRDHCDGTRSCAIRVLTLIMT
jgi:sorting nexin-9/18/33